MKKITLIILIVLTALGRDLAREAGHDTLFVATWNLENLFDTTNDAGKSDGEFTPESNIQWTQKRLDRKLTNLSKVIKEMNYKKGPDILGVVEVEHRSLLDSLIERYLKENYYKVAYKESPDKRGIDNGIIYNSKKLKLLNIVGDTVVLPDKYPTRLILNANFLYKGKDTLVVFENHWPARIGGEDKTEPNRISAAETLHKLVELYTEKNAGVNIIIMGDFNDEPGNKSVKEILAADSGICVKNNDSNTGKSPVLFNLAYADFSKGLGTYKYRNTWDMLDQIIISRNMSVEGNLKYVCGSFQIFKPSFMVTKSGKYEGTPFPTYGGRKYLGGYSDHFPVTAKFVYSRR